MSAIHREPPSSARWIVGAPQDLALIIAAPLLIVPIIAFVQLGVSVEKIALGVAAFGALGHHLPGMMRAYGDRELFERFKVRFIAAPIFLSAVCVFFALRDLLALTVIALVWGVWHGLAQVYGFARIYDAKSGGSSPLTSRFDLALVGSWFGAGMLFSPERSGDLLQKFYDCGGPLIPAASFHSFQTAWGLVTALASLAFAVNLGVEWRRGRAPCLPKLLLIASSIGFWWYAMIGIRNAILGIAIFEIFHDAQYLTIVWAFNRRVIEKGGRVGAFTRFLFRRSGAMVVLYLGLILAYGAVALANDAVFTGTVHRVFLGIIVASGLLHFYYDGFIWKVRDRSIKAGLDVEGGALTGDGDGRPRWLRHAVAWCLFIVPTGMLAATQSYTPHASKLDDYANIRAAVPDDNRNRLKLASALFTRDRLEEAAAEYEQAIDLQPDNSIGYVGLGKVRSEQERWGKAILAYGEAARLDPYDSPTQLGLGVALLSSGALADAQTALEAALKLDPESYDATAGLGALHQTRGANDRARRFYASAIEIDPNAAAAYYNLAVLNEAEGDLRAATEQYRNALRVEPNATAALEDLRRLESQP